MAIQPSRSPSILEHPYHIFITSLCVPDCVCGIVESGNLKRQPCFFLKVVER